MYQYWIMFVYVHTQRNFSHQNNPVINDQPLVYLRSFHWHVSTYSKYINHSNDNVNVIPKMVHYWVRITVVIRRITQRSKNRVLRISVTVVDFWVYLYEDHVVVRNSQINGCSHVADDQKVIVINNFLILPYQRSHVTNSKVIRHVIIIRII